MTRRRLAAPADVLCPAQMVRQQAKARPDHAALVCQGVELTYAELDERSSRVAAGLKAAGLGARDRAVVIGKNSIEHFELLLGALKLGAICIDLSWRLSPAELEEIVDDATATFVAADAFVIDAVVARAPSLLAGRKVVCTGGDASQADAEPYSQWRDRHPAADPGFEGTEQDIAFHFYTSGSTGLPKGVLLSNRNNWGYVEIAHRYYAFHPDAVILVAMPLFHIGGMGWSMAGLSVGATLVVMPDVDLDEVLDLIEVRRVTHILLTPVSIAELMRRPRYASTDLSSVELVLYGSAPMPEPVLHQLIATTSCEVWQGYGMTETTGTFALLSDDDHRSGRADLLRSAGRPALGVELRIVDPATGEDLVGDAVGEIWVRSSNVTVGYWRPRPGSGEAFAGDGWFRTGDAGYRDAEGYVYLRDRVKDMIISGGENVYPAEVERVLATHPAVREVAVIGVPSERWGETPLALVVPEAGTEPTPDELIAYCRERIAHFKCPTAVELRSFLERNPSGKFQKHLLRAPYWRDRERSIN
ncbi:long-chain-fatty-acid--CoA ligase [Micromonospora sp. HUAS LYJ1]|uniref:long-chain-fatty-acid--CoA ligase n=1 Tax=Micromonospora sp. HUAS LYJ1 TaxID=3061626 RepID=UPI0026741FEA|nr:long-chain-fatty-acid--CoA ligase [Micromonospora sp. HUAS LYJ1]WKU03537.1 long-chain-fatty-acid--CoA ligase [Micromonospora sp. HUAS LYJ1]